MKIKKLTIVACLLVAVAATYAAYRINSERVFASLPAITNNPTGSIPQDIVRVLIVGDSWVNNAKLDEPLKQALADRGISSQVQSFGYPGKKSGEIFKALQNESIKPVDFVIIIAGVNDTAGHIGADYYSHHMQCLQVWAINFGAVPIILQIPRYGINEAFTTLSISGKAKKTLCAFLFDDSVDTITHYRASLKILDERTKLINPDPILNYPSSLYLNPSHLNNFGNQHLADLIAERILRDR